MYHSLVYDFKVGPTNIYALATPMNPMNSVSALRQYTTPHIISRDPISFGFLVYIDAVCKL